MTVKLSEALIRQKRIKNRIDDILFRIEKIEPLVLPEITCERRREEEERARGLLRDYRNGIDELISVKRAVQRAGFESGVKEKLVELEELKGLLSKLRGLGSRGPMGEQSWESLHSSQGGETVSRLPVQNFWPVNQRELQKEKAEIAARIEALDIEIQKTNWQVDVEI